MEDNKRYHLIIWWGDLSISKEDIIDLMKRERLKKRIEGGYHEREGTDEAALCGGAMGATGKFMGKLVEKSRGTVLRKLRRRS